MKDFKKGIANGIDNFFVNDKVFNGPKICTSTPYLLR